MVDIVIDFTHIMEWFAKQCSFSVHIVTYGTVISAKTSSFVTPSFTLSIVNRYFCLERDSKLHQMSVKSFHLNNLDIRRSSNFIFHVIKKIKNASTVWRSMMTSPNGNIFRVTGHLCGKFTGCCIGDSPHKGQWRGALMCSLICAWKKRLNKQPRRWWFKTPSRSLWRDCNVRSTYGYALPPFRHLPTARTGSTTHGPFY